MFVVQLALVSLARDVTPSQLNRVAAALQKQALRDFAPLWGVSATVDAFERPRDIPLGYWPIVVVGEDLKDAAGYHKDENGQPFAVVENGPSLSLTASHEMLEMLADPFGDRLVAGKSPHPDQGKVEFLVEVADPSEDARFGYLVNGLLVSDFYTPDYFSPGGSAHLRYSFGGHIKAPRTVLPGGYLSWREPVTGHWWQQTWFGGDEPSFVHLGPLSGHRSLRGAIDAATRTGPRLARTAPESEKFALAKEVHARAKETNSARADALRGRLEALNSGAAAEGGFGGAGA